MPSDPSQPTQPLTDAELARIDKICEGGWTPAGLDQGRLWVTLTRHREANQVLEQAAILAVQTKDEVVAENARLRAENTALRASLDQFNSFPDNPGPGNWSPSYRMGYADAGRDVRAIVRALGLDQDGRGQANG